MWYLELKIIFIIYICSRYEHEVVFVVDKRTWAGESERDIASLMQAVFALAKERIFFLLLI